jgi:transcriptional regulator with PAS, ATPase and Fis domain
MAATSNAPVLIEGESGTGKELVARAIHKNSSRSHVPLITVNCGAFPDTLIKSELFGSRRDSFIGATNDRDGLIEAAHKGTLFLDEISNTSPSL